MDFWVSLHVKKDSLSLKIKLLINENIDPAKIWELLYIWISPHMNFFL